MVFLKRTTFITCSYIPPCSDSMVYDAHVTAIASITDCMNKCDSIVILGDFNLPNVSWHYSSDSSSYDPSSLCPYYDILLENISDLGVYQINGVLNSNEKMLDLVFVDDVGSFIVSCIDPISVPEDRYHPTLGIIFEVEYGELTKVHDSIIRKSFCFKHTNYNDLNDMLQHTDWSFLFNVRLDNVNSIDFLVENFYNIMNNCFSKCVPQSHQKFEHLFGIQRNCQG